jgi:hypothetical protein
VGSASCKQANSIQLLWHQLNGTCVSAKLTIVLQTREAACPMCPALRQPLLLLLLAPAAALPAGACGSCLLSVGGPRCWHCCRMLLLLRRLLPPLLLHGLGVLLGQEYKVAGCHGRVDSDAKVLKLILHSCQHSGRRTTAPLRRLGCGGGRRSARRGSAPCRLELRLQRSGGLLAAVGCGGIAVAI